LGLRGGLGEGAGAGGGSAGRGGRRKEKRRCQKRQGKRMKEKLLRAKGVPFARRKKNKTSVFFLHLLRGALSPSRSLFFLSFSLSRDSGERRGLQRETFPSEQAAKEEEVERDSVCRQLK
jgi:hypothetical protein